jgi:hypothetical protein
VRLGTCIALEIVTGLVAIGAASMGTAWAVGELREPPRKPGQVAAVQKAPRPSAASEPVPVAPVAPPPVDAGPVFEERGGELEPTPLVEPAATTPAMGDTTWAFAGQPDEPLLAPLRTGKLTRVKFNRGGTSLSLRLDFDNGARAAYKPEQTHLHSMPRKEIAAYRIDRMLGIGRVPPAIGRSFTLAEMVAVVDQGQKASTHRLRDEMISKRGVTKGEMSWWIPVLGDMYIGRNRIDSTDAIVQWRKWLKAGATIPVERRALCEQISAMALFDFLIDNTDRWSGNNARASEDGTVLYFMDNTLAFSKKKHGGHKSELYLRRVQTFSRGLVARIRALKEADVRAVLARDVEPFDQLLNEAEITAMMSRRDVLMEYVDGLVAQHGEAKVLVFP